jgi:hypothetical protein
MKKEKDIRKIQQGTLAEGEGSVQLTSSLRYIVLQKNVFSALKAADLIT